MPDFVIRQPHSSVWASIGRPWGMLRVLVANRALIWRMGSRDAMAPYRGAGLGTLWAVVQPLLTLGVYTFVFSVIFPSRWGQLGDAGDSGGFALHFFAGYVLFSFFGRVVEGSPWSVAARPELVKRVVFPVEVLPVVSLASPLVFVVIGVVLVGIGQIAIAGTFSVTLPLVVLVLVPLAMMALGCAWVLAAVGVYIRDVRHIAAVAVQLLFFLTPIFYPLSAVPERFRWAIGWNPLTGAVENGRRVLLHSELPEWWTLGLSYVLGAVAMAAGYAVFGACRRGFADAL
ncbi:MAG: ABC transporter permease [Planctomycetota bacterium]